MRGVACFVRHRGFWVGRWEDVDFRAAGDVSTSRTVPYPTCRGRGEYHGVGVGGEWIDVFCNGRREIDRVTRGVEISLE